MLRKTLLTALALTYVAAPALADPCGMVPPIYLPGEPQPELSRVGIQQTYGFYANGVETLVIRPEFTGSVEEFGMLVPFPSPPAIRKIDDKTFDHIAAAVDPPVVSVHMYDDSRRRSIATEWASDRMKSAAMEMDDGPMRLRRDQVKVLNQEAVGMYEVAVLAAGSPKALEKWMTQHAFQYPGGMEDVVEDYVQSRWVFVAIKAQVGGSGGTDPRPGMRSVDTGLPAGTSFDGYVQGMGFRFEVDAPVIPMRLSTFNGNDLHNRVYFLSEAPVKVHKIGGDLVRRQIHGRDLHRSLIASLDVEVHNGQANQITDEWWEQIEQLRDPSPYNGVARDLFASDLLAARGGELSLPFEEREKALLRISEGLGLRGAPIDALHDTVLSKERQEVLEGSLWDVRDLTLTVIDGDFPKQLLASENLQVEPYEMASSRNSPDVWNNQKPGPEIWVPFRRGWESPW